MVIDTFSPKHLHYHCSALRRPVPSTGITAPVSPVSRLKSFDVIIRHNERLSLNQPAELPCHQPFQERRILGIIPELAPTTGADRRSFSSHLDLFTHLLRPHSTNTLSSRAAGACCTPLQSSLIVVIVTQLSRHVSRRLYWRFDAVKHARLRSVRTDNPFFQLFVTRR